MTRLTRVALVATIALACLWAGKLAAPEAALACSCVATDPNAPFDGSEDAVLLGKVGAHVVAGRFAFAVERWFKGEGGGSVQLQSATVPMGGNEFSYNTCGLDLQAGSRLIVAAHNAGGWLEPSACSPHADANTQEGRDLIAAAARAFGPGFIPGAPPPEPANDLGTIAMGAAATATFVIVLLLSVQLLRRRARGATE